MLKRMREWILGVRPLEDTTATSVQTTLSRVGNYLYSALVVLITGSILYFATMLSGAQTIAEIRPTLQSALAPLAAWIGVAPPPATPRGPMVVGVGEVVALDALEIHSPVSARIRSLSVQVGDLVQAGDVIALLDDAGAARALRDADLEEKNARLELERARLLSTQTESNPRENAVREAATILADVFTNMPWVVNESDSILYDTTLDDSRANINFLADKARAYPETATYRDAAATSFAEAAEAYRTTRLRYQAWKPGEAGVVELLRDTELMLQAVVRSLVAAQSFFTFVKDHYAEPPVPPMVLELEKGIADRAKTASDNLNFVSYSLAELSAPQQTGAPNAIDLRDAELRLEAAIHAKSDREAEMANYTVRSPIAGEVSEIVRKTAVVEGEILARVSSPQTVARISISEGDVGKIRAGMDVRLSFPGLDGLGISGRIVSIDRAANVADNTVTFSAYVSFPEGEQRPRPGMSVNAEIPL